jgi:hypothetical protein
VTKAYFKRTKDREPGFAKVRAVVAREAPDSSLLLTVEGEFFIDYAWDARTDQRAAKVTAEQFKVFKQRLKVAATALEKAWQLDNKNSRAAASRITVAMGLQENRAEVDRWFDRAKQADPNNLTAYRAKLLYLQPKWHGDAQGQDMLAFGRECAKAGNWEARVPFLLIEAHESLSKYPKGDRTDFASNPDPAYFALPGVWADVQSVYEPYLKRFPAAHAERSKYARLACWAGQWPEANRQFQVLGNNVDRAVFSNADELNRLRKEAAEKAK